MKCPKCGSEMHYIEEEMPGVQIEYYWCSQCPFEHLGRPEEKVKP